MNIISKRKLSIGLFLTLLSISCFLSLVAPNTQAMTFSNKDKGLIFLNTIIGLNVSDYSISTETLDPGKISDVATLSQEMIQYNLISKTNVLKIVCTFVNGQIELLNVLENNGTPDMLKSVSKSDGASMAADFMTRLDAYSKYVKGSSDTSYEKFKVSLEGVDASKNNTKIVDNAQLEIKSINNEQIFRWTFTSNGAIAPSKFVSLSFENGFLKYFVNRWSYYNVADVNPDISKEKAIDIALKAAQGHNWSIRLDAASLSSEQFNTSNVRWTKLMLDDSYGIASIRNMDLLTIYPVWRIGIALDKWYGQLYGIEIAVWADTGQIRSIDEAWSLYLPSEDMSIEKMTEQKVDNSEPALMIMTGVPAFAICITAIIWVNRQNCRYSSYLTKKLRLSKLVALLLSLLITSTVFLGVIETASATTRASVVWGSVSYGAGSYQIPWINQRKSQAEVDAQNQTAIDLETIFDSVGYTGENHQKNLGSTKQQILTDISYYQNYYDYTAIIDFDHGVTGYPNASVAPINEAHYQFEDARGTYYDGSGPHNGSAVYDLDIYPLIQTGNKIFFQFMSTCKSAETSGQGLLPAQGQHGSRAYTLPFAWTHRYIGTGGMSSDGYGTPDSGSQVYIGFPNGSASLSQLIPLITGTNHFRDWVIRFFQCAVYNEWSVNYALDQASLQTWGFDFGSSPLRTGFDDYWEGLPIGYSSTMAVYGNGRIYLKDYVPDYVSRPSVGGQSVGYVDTSYTFYASSDDSVGHRIQYTFDWGDQTQQDTTGLVNSGQVGSYSHSWSSSGIYQVKVRAQCENSALSSWSYDYTVNIGNIPILTVSSTSDYLGGELYGVPVYIDSVYCGTTPLIVALQPNSYDISTDSYFAWFGYICCYYNGNSYYTNPTSIPIYSSTSVNLCFS